MPSCRICHHCWHQGNAYDRVPNSTSPGSPGRGFSLLQVHCPHHTACDTIPLSQYLAHLGPLVSVLLTVAMFAGQAAFLASEWCAGACACDVHHLPCVWQLWQATGNIWLL